MSFVPDRLTSSVQAKPPTGEIAREQPAGDETNRGHPHDPPNHHRSMTTGKASDFLTRHEYLVLTRHIQRDLERDAEGTFYKLDPETGHHVFNEREADIVQKALRKIRAHLLTVERRS